MPAFRRLPTRRTFEGAAEVAGWTPDGKIYTPPAAIRHFPKRNSPTWTPQPGGTGAAGQASQGAVRQDRRTLFFTRLPFQGSYAKRYQGGTAQNIWKYIPAAPKPRLSPATYAGTSKNAMWWNGRVYFLCRSRRHHEPLVGRREPARIQNNTPGYQGWDVRTRRSPRAASSTSWAPTCAFRHRLGRRRAIPIDLSSDFDHLREHWVKNPSITPLPSMCRPTARAW